MRTFSIMLAALVLAAPPGFAAEPPAAAPVVPCDAAPVPGYADVGQLPEPLTWKRLEWQPPRCIADWPSTFRFVIALGGRIGKADSRELLARLGAISTSRGVPYFSVTENAWRTLIKDAAALGGADPALRRADFTADELSSGASLFYVEEDNRSSKPVVYRMRVLQATRSRIVVQTSNVTPVESFMLTLFPPDTLLAVYILTRLEGGEWGLYAMSAATMEASGMVSLGTASYVNRAQALFGHLAGITPPASADATR
ncbi:MAG TPA: DUF6675 family protein [Usitatibacter sp.]|nr:DUF6675 family protein [Usitatibacter sp.]